MFSDSSIAKDFACGETECSYIVKFGLSPYFLELLNLELNNALHYIALFDESYNNAAKENQMDLHIQRMLLEHDFMALIFLEKSSAKDILHGFETCLGALSKEKMIHIFK